MYTLNTEIQKGMNIKIFSVTILAKKKCVEICVDKCTHIGLKLRGNYLALF